MNREIGKRGAALDFGGIGNFLDLAEEFDDVCGDLEGRPIVDDKIIFVVLAGIGEIEGQRAEERQGFGRRELARNLSIALWRAGDSDIR